jgi:hypothetical protein
LEHSKGIKGHVDLDALKDLKKANKKGTAEWAKKKENEHAHSLWTSMIERNTRKRINDIPLIHYINLDAVFNDVDEAQLELDGMNSGQLHRLRTKAELEASKHSRGGYAGRGGRVGQSSRGGRSQAMSR